MSNTLSRRTFLKSLGIGSAGLLLPSKPEPAEASAESSNLAPGVELATLLDLSKCIGCGECVAACHESNAAKFPEPKKPFPTMYPPRVKVADWSDKRDVDDRLTPYNWLYIQTAEVEWKGEALEINIPRRCLHCQNPPCANLCPWGAAGRQSNGIVRIDPDVCLGGSKCRSVCPWKIPQRQTGVGLYLDILPNFAGNGVMFKCDRCFDKVAEGKLPACIEVCPEDVQTIGPRDEIVKKAHELAESMDGYIYGEHENGGTNTLYVSPVPFDLLDAAVEKGPGRPDLAAQPDMMSKDKLLATAALTAPVAGIAAALIKGGRRISRAVRDEDTLSREDRS